PRRTGREDRVRAAAGNRHDFGAAALNQHDRHAIELDETAQLADERAEGEIDVEGGGERTSAPVRGFEKIDPTAELIPQVFRAACSRLGKGRLVTQSLDEPADNQPCDQQDSERKRHTVEDEAWAPELMPAPPLDADEKREDCEGDSRRAQQPVTQRSF